MTQSIPIVPVDLRQWMLRQMLTIRQAEDEIQDLFLANLVRGTTHLAVGQEACAVGTAAALQSGDTVTCTYRGHHHALALGMSVKSLMAEMMGKASGACKGKGGSMHMTDASIGLLGANAIVGGQIPIAVGAGLTAQLKKTGAVSVTFFGDGTTNIGAFHEAMNLAAIWKLPVLFICENNQYGEYSAIHKTTPINDLAVRAGSYNMPGDIVDGQDAEAIYDAVSIAAVRARDGKGPSFLELKTYRYRGHSRTDAGPYRPEGELEEWLKRDPIDILKGRMIAAGQLDDAEFTEMQNAAKREVHTSLEWAKAEPFPILEELLTDIYYEG